MLLIDAHLDLSMNSINWDRNLDLSVQEIREAEAHMTEKGRGKGTVTLPELRRAEIALCLATVIDRTARPGSPATGSACQEISCAKARGQMAYYRVLEAQGKVRILEDFGAVSDHLSRWQRDPANEPLGFILAMEGADPIAWPEQVVEWYEMGMRVVGPSHYGVSAYSYGTGTEGGMTDAGRVLLREMDAVGMILDLTHLAEQAFWEALDQFTGPVLASHNNCRALVPGDRQFSDDQIRAIAQRGGVIGAACDAWMLYPGWVIGETDNSVVDMTAVVDHIDHVCQVTGCADHVGIGSDLDGGYGTEQCPSDLDTIYDLQKIPALLEARGYSQADVEQIMHGNWIRYFEAAWG